MPCWTASARAWPQDGVTFSFCLRFFFGGSRGCARTGESLRLDGTLGFVGRFPNDPEEPKKEERGSWPPRTERGIADQQGPRELAKAIKGLCKRDGDDRHAYGGGRGPGKPVTVTVASGVDTLPDSAYASHSDSDSPGLPLSRATRLVSCVLPRVLLSTPSLAPVYKTPTLVYMSDIDGPQQKKRKMTPNPEDKSDLPSVSGLLIKRHSEKARLPTRGSALAAGYDLYRYGGHLPKHGVLAADPQQVLRRR